MYITDDMRIHTLRGMRNDGVPVRWEVSVTTRMFHPREGSWHGQYLDIEWTSLDYDPELLGSWLADVFAGDAEVDDDYGDIMIDDAWQEVEAAFMPEQVEDTDAGKKWWLDVEWSFRGVMEEISNEWRAERKYGHPSLTAAERNPGMTRGY